MRVRSTQTGEYNVPAKIVYTVYDCAGNPSETSYTGMIGSVSVKTIRDVVTPRFGSIKKNVGFLPLNPMSISTDTVTVLAPQNSIRVPQVAGCQGQYSYTEVGPYAVPRRELIDLPDVPEAVIKAVVNSAAAKANSGAWDALTFAGEFGDTVRMFRSFGSGLKGFVSKAKRAHARLVKNHATRLKYERINSERASRGRKPLPVPPRAKKASSPPPIAEYLSSAWLTYRYGLMPLWYDIQDSIKALNMGMSPPMVRERATQTLSGTLEKQLLLDSPTASQMFTEQLTYTYTIRGWAASEIKFQNRVTLDPIRTAYELIPFSFVLDWFLDYGSYIEAISPFGNGNLLGTCASVKIEYTRTLHYEKIRKGPHTGGCSGLLSTRNVRSYERFPYGVSLPGLNPRLNLARVTDAVALATSILISANRRS